MSGGSMEYLYRKVEDASFYESTPQRKALRRHLNDLAKVLRCVEWNDSGDGCSNEDEKIEALLGHSAVIAEAVKEAERAAKQLQDALDRATANGEGSR